MYLIYGAGKVGTEFLTQCIEKKIEGIILTDSNSDLWGKEINGFVVLNPNKIKYEEVELVVISTRYNFYSEIKQYILTKVDEEKIAYYEEVLLFSQSEILNLGSVQLDKNNTYPCICKTKYLKRYFDEQSFNDLDKFFYQREHRLIHKFIHYTEGYDRFFSKFRGKKVTLLEIGVYQGGSLQMWKDYLGEKAQIIGLDINPECKKVEEENIKIFIGDQQDREYLRWLKKQIDSVDIIIDDGGHMMEQQIISFEELFDILSDDGVYLCEDCHTSYWASYHGGYKKEDTFIEYSKTMIDGLNVQYMEEPVLKKFRYSERIKSLTFYDSMVFIEKKGKSNKSIALKIGS